MLGFDIFADSTVKAVRKGAVFMVGGGMPSKGNGGRATDTL